jgi:hypothetical protein
MIEKAFIISLLCFGFYQVTRFGQIMFFVQRFAAKLPAILGKPICLCLTCMASFHTLFWYPIFYGFDLQLVPVAIIAAGLNYLIGILSSHYE